MSSSVLPSRTAVLDSPADPHRAAPAPAALAELRQRYRQAVPATLAAFERFAAQLLAAPDAEPVLVALRRELHRVHGSGGAYGFAEASRIAAALEAQVGQWIAEPSLDRDRRGGVVRSVARLLARAFELEPLAAAAAPASGGGARGLLRLLLVGFAPAAAARLRVAAAARGMAASAWIADECTAAAIARLAPDVVVVPAGLHPEPLGLVAASGLPLLVAGPRREDDVVPAGAVSLPLGDDVVPLLELAERLAARTAWRGASIVVVDDDLVVLAVVRELLAARGFHVVALAGTAGLEERLVAERPVLLLLDVHLGAGEDGIALTRRLRAHRQLAELPVLLLSGDTGAETRTRAFEAGADEFLAKPVVPAELHARIEDRLWRERLRALAAESHPATRLPLPARTRRELARALDDAADAPGGGGTLAVARALADEDGEPDAERATRWTRDAARLGAAVRAVGGVAGHRDDAALALWLPRGGAAAAALLADLAGTGAWRAAVRDAAGRDGAALDALLRDAVEALDAADAAGTAAPVTHAAPGAAGDDAPDVVIVEDDPVLAEMLQFAVRSAGLRYRTHASGPAALEALLALRTGGAARPLVLLDVDLPGLDGHSLHERLQAERPGAYRVVFTSAHAGDAGQLRALRAGALDYVVKPISLPILLAKLPLWTDRARGAA